MKVKDIYELISDECMVRIWRERSHFPESQTKFETVYSGGKNKIPIELSKERIIGISATIEDNKRIIELELVSVIDCTCGI